MATIPGFASFSVADFDAELRALQQILDTRTRQMEGAQDRAVQMLASSQALAARSIEQIMGAEQRAREMGLQFKNQKALMELDGDQRLREIEAQRLNQLQAIDQRAQADRLSELDFISRISGGQPQESFGPPPPPSAPPPGSVGPPLPSSFAPAPPTLGATRRQADGLDSLRESIRNDPMLLLRHPEKVADVANAIGSVDALTDRDTVRENIRMARVEQSLPIYEELAKSRGFDKAQIDSGREHLKSSGPIPNVAEALEVAAKTSRSTIERIGQSAQDRLGLQAEEDLAKSLIAPLNKRIAIELRGEIPEELQELLIEKSKTGKEGEDMEARSTIEFFDMSKSGDESLEQSIEIISAALSGEDLQALLDEAKLPMESFTPENRKALMEVLFKDDIDVRKRELKHIEQEIERASDPSKFKGRTGKSIGIGQVIRGFEVQRLQERAQTIKRAIEKYEAVTDGR